MAERVVESRGTTVRSRGAVYKAVVQSVLLYDSKRWVVTREMLSFLEGFHQQEAQQITGMTKKRGAGGEWDYP